MSRRFLFGLLLGAVLFPPWTASTATAVTPEGRWGHGPGISRADRTLLAQAGEITAEKLERWRRMTPEEREKIRERYRRWKSLPPGQRERILERRRRWRSLPETSRRYLRERREIYRRAGPEEKRMIEKFVRRMRQLSPRRRQLLRSRIGELGTLPPSERDARLMDWPFYRRLSPVERNAVNRFLFSEPPGSLPGGSRERPHE